MGTSSVLDENFVTRHFLDAIESHIADQKAQGTKQESGVPSGPAFVHHAYKAEKAKLEARTSAPGKPDGLTASPGHNKKLPEQAVSTASHQDCQPASASRQREDSLQADVTAQQAPSVTRYEKVHQAPPPPPPPPLPAAFRAEYASQASQPGATTADNLTGEHQPQSAAEHNMVDDVSRMFSASDSQPGAEGVPASAASAGAKAKARELGQEGLAELLMAWYYAGYCTGRHEAMRTESS